MRIALVTTGFQFRISFTIPFFACRSGWNPWRYVIARMMYGKFHIAIN